MSARPSPIPVGRGLNATTCSRCAPIMRPASSDFIPAPAKGRESRPGSGATAAAPRSVMTLSSARFVPDEMELHSVKRRDGTPPGKAASRRRSDWRGLRAHAVTPGPFRSGARRPPRWRRRASAPSSRSRCARGRRGNGRLPHLGPAPEPEGHGDVAGDHVAAQLPAELHQQIRRVGAIAPTCRPVTHPR